MYQTIQVSKGIKGVSMKKNFCVAVAVSTLVACGGGGGGGSDPSAYSQTTSGAGSTVSSAEATGAIKYVEYQQTPTAMSDKSFSLASVNATATFDTVSKQGSIQFPVMGASQVITTSDGYATSKWTGPFLSGLYKFNGNILLGCYAAATLESQKTQVFVSSSLTRVQDGFIDDLRGTSFDLVDCSLLSQGSAETLKFNSDGTIFLSTANVTIPKDQVFDMLNPEKYPGVLINNGMGRTTGVYSGHAFKYGANGVTKYAIVIQTNANNTTTVSNYHYLLAVQR